MRINPGFGPVVSGTFDRLGFDIVECRTLSYRANVPMARLLSRPVRKVVNVGALMGVVLNTVASPFWD